MVRIASEEYKKVSHDVIKTIEQVVAEVVAKHDKDKKIGVTINKRAGYRPVTHRDPELVDLSAQAAQKMIPNAQRIEQTIMGGEDFTFYLEQLGGREIPGTFTMVGGANKERGIPQGPHHTPNFRIDPDVLQELAAIHVATAQKSIEHFRNKQLQAQ